MRSRTTGAVALAAAGLLGATIAEAGLYALSRGLRGDPRPGAAHQGRAASTSRPDRRAREGAGGGVGPDLQRERANAGHALSQQERKLTIERRDMVARQADRARAELASAIEQIQEQLEQRLTAWAADLDRGQRGLEARLNALAQRQAEAIKAYEARSPPTPTTSRTATEEQQTGAGPAPRRARAGRARVVRGGPGRDRGVRGGEPPRSSPRSAKLREQERSVREQIEREEADAITRIQASFETSSGGSAQSLERSLERATQRLVEEAERRFDTQIKESREKSAQRLSHELERRCSSSPTRRSARSPTGSTRRRKAAAVAARAAHRRHHARGRTPAGGRGRAAPPDERPPGRVADQAEARLGAADVARPAANASSGQSTRTANQFGQGSSRERTNRPATWETNHRLRWTT